MSEPQTSNLLNELLQVRAAGATYAEVARQFGISEVTARYRVKSAVKRGIVTGRQVRYQPARKPRKRFTPEAYERQWMARMKAKVIVDANGCWRYQGHRHPKGYGMCVYRGKGMNAHRAMWLATHKTPLTTEQYVLHKCDVRDCINPQHLWIGSAKDNNVDCARKGRHCNGVKTHCKRGHPYDEENTEYRKLGNGSIARSCKACQFIHSRLALGWTLEEAMNTPRIPPGVPTKRRYLK